MSLPVLGFWQKKRHFLWRNSPKAQWTIQTSNEDSQPWRSCTASQETFTHALHHCSLGNLVVGRGVPGMLRPWLLTTSVDFKCWCCPHVIFDKSKYRIVLQRCKASAALIQRAGPACTQPVASDINAEDHQHAFNPYQRQHKRPKNGVPMRW